MSDRPPGRQLLGKHNDAETLAHHLRDTRPEHVPDRIQAYETERLISAPNPVQSHPGFSHSFGRSKRTRLTV